LITERADDIEFTFHIADLEDLALRTLEKISDEIAGRNRFFERLRETLRMHAQNPAAEIFLAVGDLGLFELEQAAAGLGLLSCSLIQLGLPVGAKLCSELATTLTLEKINQTLEPTQLSPVVH
jgi:hypothetical protein